MASTGPQKRMVKYGPPLLPLSTRTSRYRVIRHKRSPQGLNLICLPCHVMLVFYGIPQSEERFGCIHCLGGCKACRNWKPAVAIGSIVKAIREGTKSGDEFRELIIDHGMQRFVNSSSPTTRGKHILRVAIEYARLSYVKILVGLGANVNSEDVHGRVVNAACSSIEPER